MLKKLRVGALTCPQADGDFCPLLSVRPTVRLAAVLTHALSLHEEKCVDCNRLSPKGKNGPKGSTADPRCLPHPLLLDLAPSGEISMPWAKPGRWGGGERAGTGFKSRSTGECPSCSLT